MFLHYSPLSPFVRKVMIAALEIGVADRIEKVRSVTSMLRPNVELMKHNPWSKIPTLVLDDGLPLIDSDVIMEYLDSLHDGPKLHPQAPEWRWRSLRWRALGSRLTRIAAIMARGSVSADALVRDALGAVLMRGAVGWRRAVAGL